jgi:small subunit ribosomal protein S17
MPGARKVRVGEVISAKMDKTVVVAVRWQQRNLVYKKPRRRITKLYAHDNENQCRLGDMVRIEETRPLSRTKRWRLLEIVERREVAEVKPVELDEGILTEEAEADIQDEAGLDYGKLVDELEEMSDEDLEDDSSDDEDLDDEDLDEPESGDDESQADDDETMTEKEEEPGEEAEEEEKEE